MARNSLKRFFPSPDKIKNHPALGVFKHMLHDPNLFHLNRHSVSVAFFWGLLIAIIPVPGQMPLAALAALVFRCNLPIAVALAWVSNPITTPFILVLSYQLGAFILQTTPLDTSSNLSFEYLTQSASYLWTELWDGHFISSWHWLMNSVGHIWKPLVLGLVVFAILSGVLGYFAMQVWWRLHVVYAWQKRKKKRLAALKAMQD